MSTNDSAIDVAEAVYALYPEIQAMYDEFPRYRKEILPSKYWEELNRKNLQQLADSKYENFKRTLARNYFTMPTPAISGNLWSGVGMVQSCR